MLSISIAIITVVGYRADACSMQCQSGGNFSENVGRIMSGGYGGGQGTVGQFSACSVTPQPCAVETFQNGGGMMSMMPQRQMTPTQPVQVAISEGGDCGSQQQPQMGGGSQGQICTSPLPTQNNGGSAQIWGPPPVQQPSYEMPQAPCYQQSQVVSGGSTGGSGQPCIPSGQTQQPPQYSGMPPKETTEWIDCGSLQQIGGGGMQGGNGGGFACGGNGNNGSPQISAPMLPSQQQPSQGLPQQICTMPSQPNMPGGGQPSSGSECVMPPTGGMTTFPSMPQSPPSGGISGGQVGFPVPPCAAIQQGGQGGSQSGAASECMMAAMTQSFPTLQLGSVIFPAPSRFTHAPSTCAAQNIATGGC